MLGEALRYPTRADEQTLVAGAILAVAAGLFARLGVLAPLALVPTILSAGYALAVLRASAAGEAAPPAFADLRALAVGGARALAVAVGYLLAPTVVLAVTLGGAAGAGAEVGAPETLGATVFVFGAGAVVLFVSLAFAYLLPAAAVEVARRGTLRAAVDGGPLRRAATDARYFFGWISAAVVAGLAAAVAGGLAALGRPGELAALAVAFYGLVAAARLTGRAAPT